MLYHYVGSFTYSADSEVADSLLYKLFTIVVFLILLTELLIALKKSVQKYKIKKSYDALITPIAISIVFLHLLYEMILKIYYFFVG